MKRNPILVYIFECSNILACVVFPCMIFFNAGGWFFPKNTGMYSGLELLDCMKTTVIAALIFAIVVAIPLLLLFVDCFVIMKGVKGFKVTILSILSAPASYPVARTLVLNEEKHKQKFHIIAGGCIFASNCLAIAGFVYYIIRIVIASLAIF